MPLQVLARIYASGAIGMNKIWQGNLVNNTFSMFIVGLILSTCFFLDKEITIQIIIYSYLLGRAGLLLFFTIFWNIKLKPQSNKLELNYLELWVLSSPLLIASASVVISESTATIFLGLFSNTSEIGLFSVSLRIAMITSFILQVTNSAISPIIAQLYGRKDMIHLQSLIYKMTIITFIIGLFIFLINLLFGSHILGIWGRDFTIAHLLLIILSFGQLINVSTGSAGVILVMAGFQKTRRDIAFISLLVNLVLSFLLISHWGALGAAIAVSLTVIFENTLKVYFVHKRTSLKIFNI